MTPDDREAARKAHNRLQASIEYLNDRNTNLSRVITQHNGCPTVFTEDSVNSACAEVIRASHAVCDNAATVAAIHRR